MTQAAKHILHGPYVISCHYGNAGANILMDLSREHIKIADFGASKLLRVSC